MVLRHLRRSCLLVPTGPPLSQSGPLSDIRAPQTDHQRVTKRPHVDWTATEMRALSEQQLSSRLQEAREAETRADAPGMGRSTKGRRLWRRNRELVEEEMERRHLLS